MMTKQTARHNVPYKTIIAAQKGDSEAVKDIMRNNRGRINRMAVVKLYDRKGNDYFMIDEELRCQLEEALLEAIFKFDPYKVR